ncbi:MAG: hypothetical protein RLP13_00280, partial [Cytophagales bacterium]
INYGQNIRIPYTSRVKEFENYIGQGKMYNVSISNLRISYMLKHNFFLDFNYTFRFAQYLPNRIDIRISDLNLIDPVSLINQQDHSQILGLGLRWNTDLRNFDF